MPRCSNLFKVTENRAQNTILSLIGQNLQKSFIFYAGRGYLLKSWCHAQRLENKTSRCLVGLVHA